MNQHDFFKDVYEVVRAIPRGKVTTYGAIAKYLGAASGARMVGYAMNASHQEPIPVPAHRVVNRTGLLTGKHHFPTPQTMQTLLEEEGHCIIEDRIIDFQNKFWDPSQALQL
jgi:methylated-DNA-protein-cysteine methyltransferase related protein